MGADYDTYLQAWKVPDSVAVPAKIGKPASKKVASKVTKKPVEQYRLARGEVDIVPDDPYNVLFKGTSGAEASTHITDALFDLRKVGYKPRIKKMSTDDLISGQKINGSIPLRRPYIRKIVNEGLPKQGTKDWYPGGDGVSLPYAVKIDDQIYLLDGHHRAIAAGIRGEKFDVEIWDLTGKVKPPTWHEATLRSAQRVGDESIIKAQPVVKRLKTSPGAAEELRYNIEIAEGRDLGFEIDFKGQIIVHDKVKALRAFENAADILEDQASFGGGAGARSKANAIRKLMTRVDVNISKPVTWGGKDAVVSTADQRALRSRLEKLGKTPPVGNESSAFWWEKKYIADQFQHDPNAGLIFERGKSMPANSSVKNLGVDGECHWNTAKLYEAGDIDGIVIGYAYDRDVGWIQHTWGVKNGKVVETNLSANPSQYFGAELTPAEARSFVAWSKTALPGQGRMRYV